MISSETLVAAATVGGFAAQMLNTAWLTRLIRRELAPVVQRVEAVERRVGLAPVLPLVASAAR